MRLCERDLSKECKGNYKDCTDCILDKIKTEIRNEQNLDYKCHRKTYDNCLRIIDKYRSEDKG